MPPVVPGLVRLNRGIAEAIKSARTSADLSQADLAEMTGINQSYVSKLESGEHSCPLDLLYKIADKLGFDVEISFAEREIPKPPVK